MQRIEIGDFLLIAEAVTGIPAETLHRSAGIPDALRAIAAPFAGFGDQEVWPEFHQKAGIYCSRIVRYHPLVDGNKRTGYLVMREFIERNDHRWTAIGQDEVAATIENLAASTLSEGQFLAWVAQRIA